MLSGALPWNHLPGILGPSGGMFGPPLPLRVRGVQLPPEVDRIIETMLARPVCSSSAAMCAGMARKFIQESKPGFAHEWACESLRYSVGILSPVFTLHHACAR